LPLEHWAGVSKFTPPSAGAPLPPEEGAHETEDELGGANAELTAKGTLEPDDEVVPTIEPALDEEPVPDGALAPKPELAAESELPEPPVFVPDDGPPAGSMATDPDPGDAPGRFAGPGSLAPPFESRPVVDPGFPAAGPVALALPDAPLPSGVSTERPT
jgi:hypothetical protein